MENIDFVFFRIEQMFSLYRVYKYICGARVDNKNFITEKELQFSKDNMLMVLLSSLYSVFDRSGTDLSNKKLNVPKDIVETWNRITQKYEAIKNPLTRIRHNLGFHGAKTEDTALNGTKAFNDLGEEGLGTAFQLIEELREFSLMYYKIKFSG